MACCLIHNKHLIHDVLHQRFYLRQRGRRARSLPPSKAWGRATSCLRLHARQTSEWTTATERGGYGRPTILWSSSTAPSKCCCRVPWRGRASSSFLRARCHREPLANGPTGMDERGGSKIRRFCGDWGPRRGNRRHRLTRGGAETVGGLVAGDRQRGLHQIVAGRAPQPAQSWDLGAWRQPGATSAAA